MKSSFYKGKLKEMERQRGAEYKKRMCRMCTATTLEAAGPERMESVNKVD